jgi:4-hydroxybenzoate polyprenyltransferase
MAGCRLLVFVTTAAAVAGTVSPAVAAAGGAQFGWVLVVTVAARWEKKRVPPPSFPLIPLMIAGISLLDGVLMAAMTSPLWLAAGAGGMLLTLAGQRLVRGD